MLEATQVKVNTSMKFSAAAPSAVETWRTTNTIVRVRVRVCSIAYHSVCCS